MIRRPSTRRRPLGAAAVAVATLLLAAPPAAAADAATAVDAPAAQAPPDFVPAGPVVEWVGDEVTEEAPGSDGQRVVAAMTGPIELTGRGNGHGIGMSQYGAQGQALVGRSTGQILRHYFKGASVDDANVAFDPRIGVLLDSASTRLVVRGGKARVRFGGTTRTSTPGEVWEVRMVGSTGACRIIDPDGRTITHGPGAARCLTADPIADNSTARISVLRPSAGKFVTYREYGRRSVVEVVPDRVSGTWRVDVVVELPLEQYLYGLAEMPYSWDMDALRAQAIAGRSYAMWRLKAVGDDPADLVARGCSCHLYDSQQDQVYAGWGREQSASWSRWKQAVDSSAGRVVVAQGEIGTIGGVVQTFYSSSSNGRTESKHELWGGSTYPYLVSVDDWWALAPATGNPHASWVEELSRSTVASRVGLDSLSGIEVARRSTSGATRDVRFLGVDDGRATSKLASGSWMRSSFGLRSTTFAPTGGNTFADIAGSPHVADILWMSDRDITRGCNSAGTAYCPGASVTRGQMAAFIKRAYDLPRGGRVFADTDGHLFERDIAALARAEITFGCGRNRFCPDRPVTRGEMAAFLARAEKLELGPKARFADSRNHLHSQPIAAIHKAGITYGCNPPDNTRFCPDAPVTRAQMASFLRRALED